ESADRVKTRRSDRYNGRARFGLPSPRLVGHADAKQVSSRPAARPLGSRGPHSPPTGLAAFLACRPLLSAHCRTALSATPPTNPTWRSRPCRELFCQRKLLICKGPGVSKNPIRAAVQTLGVFMSSPPDVSTDIDSQEEWQRAPLSEHRRG